MKPSKTWLIVSVLCIIVGAALMLISGVRDRADLDELLERSGRMEQVEEKTLVVTEDFRNVTVLDSSTDVKILPSRDGSCRVIYGQSDRVDYRVTVERDTLQVIRSDKPAEGGLRFSREEIPVQVYLPRSSYEALTIETGSGEVKLEAAGAWTDVQIRTGSGDVEAEELQTGTLFIETGSGEIELKEVQAERLEWKSSSGRQRGTQIVCSGDAALTASSGEIELEHCRLGSLKISTTSGDVRLSQTSCGENVRVDTDSGDIRLRSVSAESYDLHTSSGSVKGSVLGSVDFLVDSSSGSIRTKGGVRGALPCRVSTGSGDVDLEAER